MNSFHSSLKVLVISSLLSSSLVYSDAIETGKEKLVELAAEEAFGLVVKEVKKNFSNPTALEKLAAQQAKITSLDASIEFWETVQNKANSRFESHKATCKNVANCKRHKSLAAACKKAGDKVEKLTDKWLKNIKKS